MCENSIFSFLRKTFFFLLRTQVKTKKEGGCQCVNYHESAQTAGAPGSSHDPGPEDTGVREATGLSPTRTPSRRMQTSS